MKLNFLNTTKFEAFLIQQEATKLNEYILKIKNVINNKQYTEPECTVNLPSDNLVEEVVQKMVLKKSTKNLKYIVVIGIGGSNLGTKAVYDSVFGVYDLYKTQRHPKIIFLDTQESLILESVTNVLKELNSCDEFLINVISKSGETTETMANLEYLYTQLIVKFKNLNDRIVFTTVSSSKMDVVAKKLGIDCLYMPNMVGGRFSVFSTVSLFPLALSGINITNLKKGAINMRDICVNNSNINKNPALASAIILYLSLKDKKNINDNFTFIPQFESLGKWYRQLMGESIGKNGFGLTPTVSVGSTDLHSVAQLYLDGPKDKITTFFYLNKPVLEIKEPVDLNFNIVKSIAGKSIFSVMDAIVKGTVLAYKNQGLDYMSLEFNSINEEEIGEFLQFKMIEMMYLGKLIGVDTFNQPAVELYKVEMRKVLEK